MAKTAFQWDASALLPDYAEVPDLYGKNEVLILTEFPRTVLNDFIEECLNKDLSMTEEIEVPSEVDGEPPVKTAVKKQMPFVEVAKQQAEGIFKYLSLATGNKQDAEYFRAAPMTSNGLGKLVELLYDLNHLDDILAARGNYLLLPSIYQAYKTEAAERMAN